MQAEDTTYVPRIGDIVKVIILRCFPRLKFTTCRIKNTNFNGVIHITELSSFFVRSFNRGPKSWMILFNNIVIKPNVILRVKIVAADLEKNILRFSYKTLHKEQLTFEELEVKKNKS